MICRSRRPTDFETNEAHWAELAEVGETFGVRPFDYAFRIPTREFVFDRNCMRILRDARARARADAAKAAEDAERRREASGR